VFLAENQQIGRLPWAHLRLRPFPQIALRVVHLANKEDVPLHILSGLIASDPAFAAEVLTVANSPLFAPRTPADSVFQAVARMGTRNVQGLCLAVGVRAFLGRSLSQPATRAVWHHNLACAVIAERIATRSSLDKDIAFTSGLMHDIGRLALVVFQPDEYTALLETFAGTAASLLDRERELFGFDHCEAGRQLIGAWRLPPWFEPVVTEHHSARKASATWQMTALTSVSCRMADCLGHAAFAGCRAPAYQELLAEIPAPERVRLPATAEQLAEEVRERIHNVESA